MLPSQLILVPDRFYWVLFSLSGSESCFTSVRVKLHDSATLPCAGRCSGVAKWTVYHKPTEVLAECDQTSCRSVKEGYQMNHDQYLKRNFSLTITDADYSTKTWYMCKCDDDDLCDADIQTYPIRTTLQIKPGESLVLEIDISAPVEVLYTSTGGAAPSRVQICTVNGKSLQCKPEYEHRANLIHVPTSALELRGITLSDSGVYWIVDKQSGEVIHIYTVTVRAFRTTRQIKPGESLELQLGRSDPVVVLYNSTGGAGPSRVQICTVNGGSLQCNPEYEHRANLISDLPPVLELRGITPSDSGVYWIVDKQSGEDIYVCTVTVQALRTTRQIEAGESLMLEIDISDPVEVLYTSTGGAAPSRVQICTVNGGSLQCNPEYEQRTNLIHVLPPVLELRGMTPHDSGVYSIVDKQSGEDIHIYTVNSMSSLYCVLFSLSGSESCSTLVTVKLHDSATLQCIPRCSGVAKWTAHNSTEVLAECDRTSCRSVKEGYRTIRDQYLKGNFPLIITDADYSMKTWFTCKCDARNICEVDVETYQEGVCAETGVCPEEGVCAEMGVCPLE
ncbi:hypothetical protein NFI96_028648 [Prochilodus magdalenae]|nr:hypothetical protein NFI96_028648 [Prochilodus magdalenae]